MISLVTPSPSHPIPGLGVTWFSRRWSSLTNSVCFLLCVNLQWVISLIGSCYSLFTHISQDPYIYYNQGKYKLKSI